MNFKATSTQDAHCHLEEICTLLDQRAEVERQIAAASAKVGRSAYGYITVGCATYSRVKIGAVEITSDEDPTFYAAIMAALNGKLHKIDVDLRQRGIEFVLAEADQPEPVPA